MKGKLFIQLFWPELAAVFLVIITTTIAIWALWPIWQ